MDLQRLVKKHTLRAPISHIREQLNSFSFERSTPKRLSDPLTVWLVDSVVFYAGAHGWRGLCRSMSESVRLPWSHELIKTSLNRLCPSLWACLRSRPHKQTKPKPHAQRALQQWLHRSSCQSLTSSSNLGKDGEEQLTVITRSCTTL